MCFKTNVVSDSRKPLPENIGVPDHGLDVSSSFRSVRDLKQIQRNTTQPIMQSRPGHEILRESEYNQF